MLILCGSILQGQFDLFAYIHHSQLSLQLSYSCPCRCCVTPVNPMVLPRIVHRFPNHYRDPTQRERKGSMSFFYFIFLWIKMVVSPRTAATSRKPTVPEWKSGYAPCNQLCKRHSFNTDRRRTQAPWTKIYLWKIIKANTNPRLTETYN